MEGQAGWRAEAGPPQTCQGIWDRAGEPRAGERRKGEAEGTVGLLTVILVFHPGAGNAPLQRLAEAQQEGARDSLLQQPAHLVPAHEAHDASAARRAAVRPCCFRLPVQTGRVPGLGPSSANLLQTALCWPGHFNGLTVSTPQGWRSVKLQ